MSDSERPEDEKFAEEFAYVFGAFPKDQAAELLIRRQKELRAACYRHAAASIEAAAKTGQLSNGAMRFDGDQGKWETPVEWLRRIASELERGDKG